MSISKKIIISTVTILFFALGIKATFTTTFFVREYSRLLQSRALAIGENLKSQLDRLLAFGIPLEDLVGFDEQCQETANKYKDIQQAMVVNLDGSIIFHNNPVRHGNLISDEGILRSLKTGLSESVYLRDVQGGHYSIILPIKSIEGHNIAALVLDFSIEPILQKTRYLAGYSLTVTIVSFLIAAILLFFIISLQVTKPLLKLVGAITQIRARGIASARPLEIYSKDEIGKVAAAFNEMTAELQKTTVSRDELIKEIDERKRMETALRASEERFRIVAQSTSDLIYEWDIKSGRLDWFGDIDAKLGYGQGEFPRTIEAWKGIIHPADHIRVLAALESHLKEKKRYSQEYRVVSKSGYVLYWIDSGTALWDKDDNAYKMFGACTDITKRKTAEKELEIAYLRLKETQGQLIQAEKLNAIGQLASSVAHEVENPLAIIIQSVDYLEDKVSPEHKDILRMIMDNIKRADNIVRTLIDFSRVTELNIVPEDINDLLDNSLVLIQHTTKFENIEVVKKYGEGLPLALIDKNKMEQVFVNILLNAIQAMPKGGKLFVRTYTTEFDTFGDGIGRRSQDYFNIGDKAVVVEIEDTGVGISEENISKVFDPFFTTKGPRAGTGLGLSVSKNIVNMHRGLIDIKSKVGQGTKVTMTFKIRGGA